ncbi:MAG: nitroreductase family protein [Bacillota bacterium]|nr:nitroreductase family protein [Bacillota bacterium]
MNETLKTILSRRSIRRFKEEQIKDEELQAILEAGKFAPSAMNQQPWHFTVVQNKELLQKINEVCRAAFLKSGIKNFEDRAKAENFTIFYNAPTFIIVSADAKAIAPQNDGSLALGYMFLAAESLDIGSCWIHALNLVLTSETGEALKKELGIPEGYIPVGSGAFGYKGIQQPSPAPRKENTVNIIK